jgi:hypothetical protein
MKKLILLMFVFMVSSVFIFAKEVYMSLGAGLGLDFATISESDYSIIGINPNMNMFETYGSNIGLFMNINAGIPLTMEQNKMEVLENLDRAITANFTMGVGYFKNISWNMDLIMGLGLHVPMRSWLGVFGAGIGGIIGLNYKLSEMFYLDFGSLVSVDFVGFDFFSGRGSLKYQAFDVCPYIAIGILRNM